MKRYLSTNSKLLYESMKSNVTRSIQLTDTEHNIRNTLVKYCNHYNQTNHNKPLTLRITGGWVRDKLLGYDSHDIDIAVNNLTGEEFVHGLQNYLRTNEPELSMNHVHTIKMNPQKSKHLETCTTKLYGIDLDFINLRSEEYTDDSRVPSIEFGTPLQDALRRDATLNALFYNLNEQEIEDFTGKGMEDLTNGVLRTPLPPIKTFLDDPLRILRLIRFASKFNFLIDSETLDAMKEKHNQEALSTKISKERIEIELRKILTSSNPGYGLQLINYCDLTSIIFFVKQLKNEFESDELERSLQQIPHHVNIASSIYLTFEQLILKSSIKHIFQKFLKDPDMRYNFWLSIILNPYVNVSSKDIFSQFLRLGLTAKKSDIVKITTINLASHDILKNDSNIRSDWGIYLRQFSSFYDLNLLVQCFLECVNAIKVDIPHEIPIPNHKLQTSDSQRSIILGVITKYESIFDKITKMNLLDVYLMKPLIDGTSLSKHFQMKPGPWLKPATEEVLKWQLDHPNGSKDECLEYIKHVVQK
ncbi:CCA1 [Candida pseudojiufengensis]|uniref:CCA1 n=1 Tax=Candida pseudojiufengensis TaxID=497109 RepID=UPI002224422A|nr:CCA1 [Candida pseudojiufengensis]KAI5962068.1 CCA1 [Candida pseudojiufengensis]